MIVAAVKKLIDYWGLSSKLNLTADPCTQGASWAAEAANPRIACECPANVCRITHLSVTFKRTFHLATCKENDLSILGQIID